MKESRVALFFPFIHFLFIPLPNREPAFHRGDDMWMQDSVAIAYGFPARQFFHRQTPEYGQPFE